MKGLRVPQERLPRQTWWTDIAALACAVVLAAACTGPKSPPTPEPSTPARAAEATPRDPSPAASSASSSSSKQSSAPTPEATVVPASPSPSAPKPTPTATPVVIPAGRQERLLMAETPQETVAYTVGSGQPGPVVLVLGGVHGNEPGGWLAAERVSDLKPKAGALIVIPRANRQAVELGSRTTDELGDLNRLYPGDPQGLPMARMAAQIVALIAEYNVNAVLDLHESWGFYKDRATRSRAFLGQTITSVPGSRGVPLGQSLSEAINKQILEPHEEMVYREYPPRSVIESNTPDLVDAPEADWAMRGGGRSSLGLVRRFPETAVLLVEMAQQQPLERRIALHVLVVEEAMRELGMSSQVD